MKLNRRRLIQSAAAMTGWAASGAGWAAAPKSLAFLSTGDWGMNGGHMQGQVAHSMDAWAERLDSRFVVAVGDNFYDAGVQSVSDPHWQNSFEKVYAARSLQTPWYAILGNHDYAGVPQAQIDYSATSSRWRMPARYYTRQMTTEDGSAVDLFFIDTTPLIAGYRQRIEPGALRDNARSQDAAAQLKWLKDGLAASKAPWKIVFGHHPVHSGGEHGDSKDLIAELKPLLERYGVQAYVCGHDHDLQHIERGVTYLCTGAGATTRRTRPIDGTQFCSDRAGFTAFRLSADRLEVDFVDFGGAPIHTASIARTRS